MKKIFYIAFLALIATLMVACDDSKGRTFEFTAEATCLRESIVYDVKLIDEDKQLEKSEIKATRTEKGTKDSKTQTVSFKKGENTTEVKFTGLKPGIKYIIKFTVAFNGKTITLLEETKETSNQGTKGNPYLIESDKDFNTIVRKAPDGYFKLTKDINFNNESILPLFTNSGSDGKFTGEFDGNGKKIYNFTVGSVEADGKINYSSTAKLNYGLFGYIGDTGKVFNLTLESFNVNVLRSSGTTSGASNFGILAGQCVGSIEGVTIKNSTLNVKSSFNQIDSLNVGSIVGRLSEKGTINNVTVSDTNINVQGSKDAVVGGICGTTNGSEIITKAVDGKKVKVNNISGANFLNGNIKVNISGPTSGTYGTTSSNASESSIGGVVGEVCAARVDNCSSTGKISFTSDFTTSEDQRISIGGLVGWNIKDISVISNSTSSVVFDIETFDSPKDEKNQLLIHAGLLVGRNGGDKSPAYSTVSNCTYTLPQGGENIIKVLTDATIKVDTNLIGKEVSSSVNNNNISSNDVSIVVVQHEVNSESKTEEVSRYSVNVSASVTDAQ